MEAKRTWDMHETVAQLTLPFWIDAGGFGNCCQVLPPSVVLASSGHRPDPHSTALSAQTVRSPTQVRSVMNRPADDDDAAEVVRGCEEVDAAVALGEGLGDLAGAKPDAQAVRNMRESIETIPSLSRWTTDTLQFRRRSECSRHSNRTLNLPLWIRGSIDWKPRVCPHALRRSTEIWSWATQAPYCLTC